ncbi:MAG: hypothetical protein BM485_07310 [Desulfobulbaceae bacterium DB1]|nr:MAG: hypothetical protein BM485_07310 [Desulfobulbaceae bacterium DB1]
MVYEIKLPLFYLKSTFTQHKFGDAEQNLFHMENIDTLIKIVELLALPLVVLFLLVLFFVFAVRPFFAFLFDKKRLDALAAVRRAQKKMAERLEESRDGDEQEHFEEQYSAENDIRADQREISKIAESDPRKAGELVRQWLKKDKD